MTAFTGREHGRSHDDYIVAPFFPRPLATTDNKSLHRETLVQLNLDFQPGLTARFPRWEDTFVHIVYSNRKGLNGVAADLDMSPSELSKRLAWRPDQKEEPRPLRSPDIVAIIEATGDPTPIYWLIEKFLRDPDAKRAEAINELARLAPLFNALAEQAGINPKLKAA